MAQFCHPRTGICYHPCIDLTMFQWFSTYSEFSFAVNGCLSCAIGVMGLFGNGFMIYSILKQSFERRLRLYLAALCFWDTLLLLSVLGYSAVPCLIQKVLTLYGTTGHLMRFLHPIARVANTASVLHILAISAERCWVVSRPLHRLQNGKTIPILAITTAILILSVALNLLSVFESEMAQCLHITKQGVFWQLTKKPLSKSALYFWLCNLIPDFIFRCPLPFVLITALTVKTLLTRQKRVLLKSCDSASFGAKNTGVRTPVLLTILNVKFLLCNSLYVVYEIIQLSELLDKRLDTLMYLGDISDFLVLVQSATNWLLFVSWPLLPSTRHKSSPFSAAELNCLNELWGKCREKHGEQLGEELLWILAQHNPTQFQNDNIDLQEFLPLKGGEKASNASLLVLYLDRIVSKLHRNTKAATEEACDSLKDWGKLQSRYQIRISNKCWNAAKVFAMESLLEFLEPKERIRAEGTVLKFCSFIIGQIKCGCLCENVSLSSKQEHFGW